jgi:hypothetical protein
MWFLGLMSLVGSAISAYGSYKEGQDAKEASNYNAAISRQNSEREAQMVEQQGTFDVAQKTKEARRFSGTQKASYGASGVELSGSVLDTMISTANEFELDKNILEYNSKVKAQSLRYGGSSQANYDQKLGDMYATSGLLKSGSTLLTAGSKVYADYKGY